MGTNATNVVFNAAASITPNGNWTGPEGITAIATAVLAVASIVGLVSILLLRKGMKSDHERSRRERAIDLMHHFTSSQSSTDRELVFGLRLIRTFTKEQSSWLWAGEQFSINAKHQSLLDHYRAAAGSRDVGSKGKKGGGDVDQNTILKLSLPEVYMLRNMAVVRLNLLELVASAWYDSVADREIIDREFVKVFCPEDGNYVLEDFRGASGIYPSIRAICEHYKEKKNRIPAKSPTG